MIYNKFNSFVANVANGKYNLGSDQLKVILTDVSPTASNVKLSDLTAISMSNLSSPNVTTVASTQTNGTYKLVISPISLTASGTVPKFRYAVLYDYTATNYELIAWYDCGAEVNMVNGDVFIVAFDTNNGVLSLS